MRRSPDETRSKLSSCERWDVQFECCCPPPPIPRFIKQKPKLIILVDSKSQIIPGDLLNKNSHKTNLSVDYKKRGLWEIRKTDRQNENKTLGANWRKFRVFTVSYISSVKQSAVSKLTELKVEIESEINMNTASITSVQISQDRASNGMCTYWNTVIT